jgi:hypothetical protein
MEPGELQSMALCDHTELEVGGIQLARSELASQHESTVSFGLSAVVETEDQEELMRLQPTLERKLTPVQHALPMVHTQVRFSCPTGPEASGEMSPLDPMVVRRSRERIPTPFQYAPSVAFVVQDSGDDVVQNDDTTPVSPNALPRRRSRSRRPTPFEQLPPLPTGVHFGLTTELDNSTEGNDVHARHGRRLVSLRLNELQALPSDALAERVATPRSSQLQDLDEFCEDADRIPVDHNAFENAVPSRRCSVAEECAVCHESFNGTEDAKLFPCGHFYHAECILQWFERQLSCPLCRRSFVQELGDTSNSAAAVESDPVQGTLQRSNSI